MESREVSGREEKKTILGGVEVICYDKEAHLLHQLRPAGRAVVAKFTTTIPWLPAYEDSPSLKLDYIKVRVKKEHGAKMSMAIEDHLSRYGCNRRLIEKEAFITHP